MEIFVAPEGQPVVFPASLATLEEAYPGTMFTPLMTAEQKAQFGLLQVTIEDQPPHDPRTEILTQNPPEQIDGRWVIGWSVRAATPEEIARWDDSNPPDPEWLAFSGELGVMPSIVNLLRIVFQVNPAFFSQLTIGLSDAAKGDFRLFLAAWSQAITAGLVDQELVSLVTTLAIKYHLPTAFVKGLEGIQ